MTEIIPRITIETITPESAARMLGTMNGNRALRQRVVQRYAREMIAGKWLLNGEAIKITREGRLIDGQHRLSAVMMAKASVKMCVVRGVDAEAMITLDTGVGRSFYDVGVIGGKSYASAVGPIARWWFRYETGSPTVNTNVATHQELQSIVDAHPGIPESASMIAHLKTVHRRCSSSVQGFVHAYASEKYDREMADSFMKDLNDGAALAADSPIFVLRKKLVDDTTRGRVELAHILAWTIKAWNAWMAGAKVKQIKWQTAGATPEEFPRFDIDRGNPRARLLRKHA